MFHLEDIAFVELTVVHARGVCLLFDMHIEKLNKMKIRALHAF